MCLRTNLEASVTARRPYGSSAATKTHKTSEKRKENSRMAARSRRDKESKLFDQLAGELPLPAQTVAQLDKASVMRLTLAVLKTRHLCQDGLSITAGEEEEKESKMNPEMDGLFQKALDGFLLVLSTDGDIVYASENIVHFLGLPQVDIMGQSLFEFTHPCDHEEARELMMTSRTSSSCSSSPSSSSSSSPSSSPSTVTSEPRHAFLRLKCTLTDKGRFVNLKSASYKVVQVKGEVVGREEQQTWLVALVTPVPHPSNIEFPLDKQTFVSRHSLDMKFTYVDDNVGEFCGYKSDDLVGRSVYEMHHALDADLLKDAYKTLRSKGQVETGLYRFLARGGGYVWLVTQATLIHGPKDHKPQCVVCLNYVVSGIESRGEILSELQLLCNTEKNSSGDNTTTTTTNSSSSNSNSNNNNNNSNNNNKKGSKKSCPPPGSSPPVLKGLATPPPPHPRPHTQPKVCDGAGVSGATNTPASPARPPVAATFKIFAPRTEDMNKGYLIFSKDDPHCTVLKEEPEDLTHLAPSGGDTCVPLLEVTKIAPSLDDDSCMSQEEVTSLAPGLDDMLTFHYPMPVENSDVLLANSVPEKSDQESNSPKYMYDENNFGEVIKCMNNLSGGQLVLRQSECSSPSSEYGSLHSSGFSTPEPPKPLLSEAALPLACKKNHTAVLGSNRPRTTTESFLTHLDESHTQGSSSELFGRLDLKPENQNMDSDEFEMRAPFIPFSNEELLLGPDDLLWGAEPDPTLTHKHSTSANKESRCYPGSGERRDLSLAQLLRDTDPPITGDHTRGLNLDAAPPPHRNHYYHNKFLDGGGNFVDPNKVLPGHYAGKEEVDSGGGQSQLPDPPPVLVQETVEPPPPLLSLDPHHPHHPHHHHHTPVSVKRGHSPLASPTLNHKKLCSPTCQPDASPRMDREGGGEQGGVRLLTTPYAPTMQQLLVSKEPITVRGGRPGGGLPTPRNCSLSDKSHSVLRNLLNIAGESSMVPSESLDSLPPSPCVPVARDKPVAMVTTNGRESKVGRHVAYPRVRLLAGAGTAHLAFKLAASGGAIKTEGGERRSQRQDPLLLMNPDTTIPNLLDLTQQDYEVNAPANNCSLLQGADLLMALDQSL